MAGVATAVLSQLFNGSLTNGSSPTRSSAEASHSPAAFREMGGQVVAFFFGAWTQFGSGRNPSPWYWINHGYDGRLPTHSVPLPGHWLGWSFDAQDRDYQLIGTPSSARAVAATIVLEGNAMSFQPTGPGAAIRTPDFYAGSGSDFPQIRFQLRQPRGVRWRCAISFTTRGDNVGPGSRVDVPEPEWGNGSATIVVDMRGIEAWMNGDIRNVSIELGSVGDAPYLFQGRFELLPSEAVSDALATVRGLPQDQQWAADWQQQIAHQNGVDAFFMCTYWDGQQSFNKTVTDAMFASDAAQPMKLGLYFDSLGSVRPQSLSEFDTLLRQWDTYFASERYWRIDGRPVIGWHGAESTRDFLSMVPEYKDMKPGDRLTAMVRHMQAYFRDRKGLHARSGLYLVTGFMIDHPYWSGSTRGPGVWEQAGFDAGTVYNQFTISDSRQNVPDTDAVDASAIPVDGAQNFAQLEAVYHRIAEWVGRRPDKKLHYFMPAIAGWDLRPWNVLTPRKSPPCGATWQCTPDQTQFRRHLKEVRDRALAAASPSFPPIVTINAWDEFGEGGFLCPTRAYGNSRIEAVRDIFGIAST
jgi:hypothetical protein